MAEREEISRGVAAGASVGQTAATLGRSASTVSREIARNGVGISTAPQARNGELRMQRGGRSGANCPSMAFFVIWSPEAR